ncbi:MAG: SDR family NAD(P)-dependent oxidoreductase [Anaerolineae bacterium]|nr:SDR family NAD(P)-dependent oxidoreductase [Anaerolineae bacterium]
MSLNDTRILVTGATGFIGARLTARLVEQGAHVSAQILPDDPSNALAPVRDRVLHHAVDIRDAEGVERMVMRVAPRVVFHLAAAGVTQPFLPIEDALAVNLHGTLNLLRAVHRVDGARVVMARTVGERINMNPYAASKSAAWAVAEMMYRTEGVPVTGLMLYQVYGAGQPARALIPSAIHAAWRGENFSMTHGRQLRDWVHVDDVVDAFVAAAQAPDAAGRTFDIGTGQGTSLRDVAAEIWRLTQARGVVQLGALPARPGEEESQVADPKPAEAALGWRAKLSLKVGLRRTLAGTVELDI